MKHENNLDLGRMGMPRARSSPRLGRKCQSALVLEALIRIATDEGESTAKMQQLSQLFERVREREAEIEFGIALTALQAELPVIDENGAILGAGGEPVSTYATWEDTVEAIRPILAKYGFSLSFIPDRSPNGHPTVTGVLRHRGGHKETGELELPPDPTGGKNAVQAIGSALSYGQRYVARMLLSLTSRGADDDAQSATRSPGAFDAIADIKASPDVAALTKWKRRSRARIAALPASDQRAVLGEYTTRQRSLVASAVEVQS